MYLSTSIVIGLLFGGAILYITWQHNPQCDFHCDGIVNWGHWLLYGLIYWIIGFAVGLTILFPVRCKTIRKKGSDIWSF
jgi:hypothetical protein